MSANVLFIGGTGIISSACSPRALEKGLKLTLLNRGKTSIRPVPEGAEVIHADISDPNAVEKALHGRTFDAVVQWIAFTPDRIETDIETFRGKTGQYVFISSASAYQTPPSQLPVTEATVLANPYWQYSRNKIACEERLIRAYREERFPVTIVRPSHTYDRTCVPFDGGWTVIDRMRKGKPVVVHGDGTSLWVLTHHADFAKGFVGLLGASRAIGEAYHITSDEWLNWNQIHQIYAEAAGAEATVVYVTSHTLALEMPKWGPGLLGDKANSMIFDNTKIKRLVPEFQCSVPLSWGAREAIAWRDADPARQQVDEEVNALMDRLAGV